MASISLGVASSHGPMLAMAPDTWSQRAETDRRNPDLYFRGENLSFDELVTARQGEDLAAHITPDELRSRFGACQVALDSLAATLASAHLDAMVVFGDDQEELYFDDNMPAFSVFTGAEFDHVPPHPEAVAKLPPGLAAGLAGRYPPHAMKHPTQQDLSRHVVSELMKADFDVSISRRFPAGKFADHGIPHAYGFVYTRLLDNKVMPQVPIFINTFYPPNQPSLSRCFAFGRAVGAAIQNWPSDARVGVVASGGLSHFVVDEQLDRAVLDAFAKSDWGAMLGMAENLFLSGSSEIKNWVALAGAMSHTTLKVDVVDYVACYRSLAGTGNGMGFATWQ